MIKFEDLPDDWENPDWGKESKAHNWRNYATGNIIGLWDEFNTIQKKCIAQCFQIIADKEV